LPRPVRHGDPDGAAQDAIGQSPASTRRKSSALTRRSFHGLLQSFKPYATTHETQMPCWRPGGRAVSQVTTYETAAPHQQPEPLFPATHTGTVPGGNVTALRR
jgi:hypothetical protein